METWKGEIAFTLSVLANPGELHGPFSHSKPRTHVGERKGSRDYSEGHPLEVSTGHPAPLPEQHKKTLPLTVYH
jgi:hypothetical protein